MLLLRDPPHLRWRRALLQGSSGGGSGSGGSGGSGSSGSGARGREADAAAAASLSSGGEAFVALLCLGGAALLAVVGWKALAWYQRSRRPGYVELQDLERAHRAPWALA